MGGMFFEKISSQLEEVAQGRPMETGIFIVWTISQTLLFII